ncbi:unnamed protein product, partial [Rodentolepis nana]|uniref:Pept_C1 domain-containing protein n=1 Tax=Rodentolepis nana TaxID=102285 RepID=A0A0R3TYG5_RODNA
LQFQEGSSIIANYCDRVGRWRRTLHALYLNCHTLDVDPNISQRAVSLELFAYLNERHDEVICHDCFAADIKSQLSGAVIVVHSAQTYPEINKEGINVQPGTLTEIKFKAIENIQKEPPYGRCDRDTKTEIPSYDGASYAYSEYGCRMYTIQVSIPFNFT